MEQQANLHIFMIPNLFFAWKELARHITYMYEISVANNRNGVTLAGMKEYRLHLEQNNKIVNSNRIKWEWSLIGGNTMMICENFSGTTKKTVEVIYR
jgi:hypothetical protein